MRGSLYPPYLLQHARHGGKSFGRNRCRGGFTLLEMVVAMSMLVVLTAALFSLMQAIITGTGISDKSIRRNQKIEAAIHLLRRSFRNLAPDASLRTLDGGTLSAYTRTLPQTAREALKSNTLRGTPLLVAGHSPLFAWQDVSQSSPALRSGSGSSTPTAPFLLATQVAEDGTLTLCTISPSWEYPIPLIEGLRDVRWSFLDAKSEKWLNEWNSPLKPPLVELVLVCDDEPESPIRSVFWIAMQQPPQKR
ncbi:MAG: type II secretion system protein J [Candidatus Methylacidiphilales bacterium]|nr:prepilin-type N-terminal cleavage/methylation domain-containing protein [Candidatus Methylacidiphilales bacterium]